MDVTLHLGAHRTGTTTLQKYLEKNRDNLEGIGTEFWGPKQTRSGLFTGLEKRPDSLTNEEILRGKRSCDLIRVALDRLETAGVKSLIVSEENMIGTMWGNLSNCCLYPEAQGRLQRFADGFESHCKRVAISIRSYEEYWASVLASLIERGRMIPNKQKMDRLVTQPRRWRDAITEIASIFPSAELVVWRFEAMIGQVNDQVALLNGGVVPMQMRGQNDWHNASAGSAKIRQVLNDGGHTALAAKIPDGSLRWQPYEAHQIAALQAQYNEDIAWLRSGADGIARYEDNSEMRASRDKSVATESTKRTDQ